MIEKELQFPNYHTWKPVESANDPQGMLNRKKATSDLF